ncbi:TlpA family protein disulfide reductase [Catenuloplanes atrovinosus]|uniref:Thiol-disulfide isomerase/thioredoxin n=1 Tax=Catenuloplanes atrovinosus TaxID=137266 RepID=A0AAE4CDJ1_9ACTN|nr:TlpA disulfide reductase family protein [Catenuloplanes atrovinosus]MDR7280273.1 thiol-disulfide isomerase/thioredoxin [Catenuloplanes atrovinosus]
MRGAVRAGAAAIALALAGCTPAPATVAAGAGDVVPASPFADCAGLAAPPGADPPEPPGEVLLDRLPELELSCLNGGDIVTLTALRGPAVINLWGSWCGPCREELPAVQAYADRAAGRVHVLGVDTADRQSTAEDLGRKLGFRFPSLFDPNRELLTALAAAEVGAPGLPATVLIDAEGRVRGVHQTTALDEAGLDRFVRDHLGVTVQP